MRRFFAAFVCLLMVVLVGLVEWKAGGVAEMPTGDAGLVCVRGGAAVGVTDCGVGDREETGVDGGELTSGRAFSFWLVDTLFSRT